MSDLIKFTERSKKTSELFSHRNDDLYKATTEKSTTSAAGLSPLFDRNLYKRPSPGSSNTGIAGLTKLSSSQNKESSNNDAPPPPPSRSNINSNRDEDYVNPVGGQRPMANRPLRRPPYRRRRPQVDYYYYDDDYEEEFFDDRGRRRQQRPRNRRPVYDDYDSRRP